MSSSTQQVSNDDCDFTGRSRSTDKSAGFKRWSRNLSAQRRRELDRLNKIERRRQFLELRRQNDLFDQMSAAVNHLPTPVSPSANSSKDSHDNNNSNSNESLTKKAANLLINESVNRSLSNDGPDVAPISNDNTTEAHSVSSQKQPVSMTSPLEQNKLGEEKQPAMASNRQSSQQSHARDKNNQTQDNGELSPAPDCSVQGNRAEQRPAHGLDSGLLAQFVSCQVPKNKRVLCLIVRDKLSRLSKTKSYFYPTYYLFLQAIVNMDEQSVSGTAHSNGTIEDEHSNDSPPTRRDLRRDLRRSALDSVDCSFSASSSISADMLFIGTANGNEASATIAAELPSGNSYSDNEICAASDEENLYLVANTNTTPTSTTTSAAAATSAAALRATGTGTDFKVKSTSANLQGRDSPLVFPNKSSDNFSGGDNTWSAARDETKQQMPEAAAVVVGCKSGYATAIGVGQNNKWPPTGEESNDDGDDFEDGESENDERHWRKQSKSNKNSHIDRNIDKPTDFDQVTQCDYDTITSLFDNERNPYAGTYGVLLASRRRKKAKTYLIGPKEHGYTRKSCICELKSNVLGTQFNAIRLNQDDVNDRFNIATISYETNVLGFKGPRKMRVLLAKANTGIGVKNLAEMIKRDPSAVVQLKNMTPSWNTESQSYVLNFHGRVTQASVKNFQLIECEMDHSSADTGRQSREKDANASKRNYHPQLEQSMKGKSKYTNALHGFQHPPQKSLTSETADSTLNRFLPSTANANNKQSLLSPTTKQEVEVDEEDESIDVGAVNGEFHANSGNGILGSNSLLAGNKSLAYNSSIVMQFGRISSHEFTCDVTYPLSILQAFSIALSSFDSKLACE